MKAKMAKKMSSMNPSFKGGENQKEMGGNRGEKGPKIGHEGKEKEMSQVRVGKGHSFNPKKSHVYKRYTKVKDNNLR